MSRIIRKFVRFETPSRCPSVRFVSTSDFKHVEKCIEEIKIPVPWGHIAGKWWGSRSKEPILCLHGWQDNANTFDTLLPLLSSKFSYLAIDLPGHGLSSHFPNGVLYKVYDIAITIRRVQRYLNLTKVSFMGHSLGGISSFIFSSFFPSDVNFFITIDAIKYPTKEVDCQTSKASKQIEKVLIYDSYNFSIAPKYSRDDLMKRWMGATNNALTEQSCEILMERGAVESNGLYKFVRDNRLKLISLSRHRDLDFSKLAESLTCSVLYIKAIDEPYLEDKQNVMKVINIIKRKAKYFEEHYLPGSHYIHLNTPEVVAPVISAFIDSVTKQ